jgi:hypothetical protein
MDGVGGLGDEGQRELRVTTWRALVAQLVSDSGGSFQPTALQIDRTHYARSQILVDKRSSDGRPGEVQFKPRGLFRIYAGRADPADKSHFTIDYELDGKPGTIDGWLREDDRIEMLPRSGAIVDRDTHGREAVWDPYSPPMTPATKP